MYCLEREAQRPVGGIYRKIADCAADYRRRTQIHRAERRMPRQREQLGQTKVVTLKHVVRQRRAEVRRIDGDYLMYRTLPEVFSGVEVRQQRQIPRDVASHAVYDKIRLYRCDR